MSTDPQLFEGVRTGRVYTLQCSKCPVHFRGQAPEAAYERHTAQHRYDQVSAVAGS